MGILVEVCVCKFFGVGVVDVVMVVVGFVV